MDMNIAVNYWGVLGAAIASMIIGMLWYGPLFGKPWMKLMGITPQSMKKMKLTPGKAMTLGFIVTLVVAYVLDHFVKYVQATSFGAAAQLGFWLWLGFLAPILLASFLWENKPFKLFVLNAAYRLVEVIVMAAILARWG